MGHRIAQNGRPHAALRCIDNRLAQRYALFFPVRRRTAYLQPGKHFVGFSFAARIAADYAGAVGVSECLVRALRCLEHGFD